MIRQLSDCIFCKIARGEIPSNKVYEDEHVLAFHDVSPQAPVHVLVIPKEHTENLLTAKALSSETLAALMRGAANAAEALSLSEDGFRIISNCGKHACQSVPHVHIHVLGGKQLSETMV